MKEIAQELVRELFDYDPETGEVTRKVSVNYNAKKDDTVDNVKDGYYQVYIYGKQYPLHRIIWLWMEGYFPEHNIDHINRVRDDNRWCNLREVTQLCNIRNSPLPSNNTSGVKGVSKHWANNLYQVYIGINKKKLYFGYFSDFTEAVAHRLAAEQALDWAGCDSNSTAYQYMQNYLKGLKNATDINSD